MSNLRVINIPFTYRDRILEARIEVKLNPKSVKIHWSPGSIDHIGDFDRIFLKQNNDNHLRIRCVVNPHIQKAAKLLQRPRYSFSLRWGTVTLHKDQLNDFLADFIPTWSAILGNVIAQAEAAQ